MNKQQRRYRGNIQILNRKTEPIVVYAHFEVDALDHHELPIKFEGIPAVAVKAAWRYLEKVSRDRKPMLKNKSWRAYISIGDNAVNDELRRSVNE